MLLSCDDDTLSVVCSRIYSVRSLGLLCRTAKGLRAYLHSHIGGVHWTNAGRLACGERFWHPLPPNHPRANDAKYVAQIRICPWTSVPQTLPIRFMQRMQRGGSENVLIKEMDFNPENEQRPLSVRLGCAKGCKALPETSYCVSIPLRPWSLPQIETVIRRLRKDYVRESQDKGLMKTWIREVAKKCDYYTTCNAELRIKMVHEGLLAAQISVGDSTQVVFFFAAKDMRLLGRLHPVALDGPGAIVFGCGEIWMLSRDGKNVLYYGPSVDVAHPCALDYRDHVIVMFRSGRFQEAIDYAKRLGFTLDELRCSAYGYTLLHHAVALTSEPAIRLLVETHGMSPNATNEDGMTAILFSALWGTDVEHMVSVLVDVGGNVNQVRMAKSLTDDAPEPMSILAEYVGSSIFRPEIVKVLIDNGADVNWRSESGYTPLWAACRKHRHTGVVRMLCRAGADVNARSASGLALFYRLIVEGVEMSWCNITQVHYIFPALYEFGCDINAESGPNNNTALMEAMARNKIECAQALMMLGM